MIYTQDTMINEVDYVESKNCSATDKEQCNGECDPFDNVQRSDRNLGSKP